MADVNAIINARGTLDAWSKFTIKDWQSEFVRLRIGSTGESKGITVKKFMYGNIRFVFEYAFYLNFVKWGVGKGMTVDDVKSHMSVNTALKTLGLSKSALKKLRGRVPKNWFGRKYRYNVYRLTELMAAKYAEISANTLKTGITNKQ